MGLEAGQFISDLVTNWPLPSDLRREGDDHIRLIKYTLKNTFPNINGAVTSTDQQLNALPASGASAMFNEMVKHVVPKGTIVMWSGLDTAVPAGWAICNGANVTGFGVVPDLRDRFIIGTGPGHALKSVGGSSTDVSDVAGAHTHVADAVALTAAQMPAHSHRVYACTGTGGSSSVVAFGAGDVAFIGDDNNLPKALASVNGSSRAIVESTGSSGTHTHGVQSAGSHSHVVNTVPPYYTLTYIIKVTDYVTPPALPTT